MKKERSTVRYSFKMSLPVMAGYLVLGFGFGILLQSKGYAWWWAGIMSLSIYAGSLQYVAIDLITAGASVITTATISVLVQIRHLFYGITMLEKYKGMGIAKPYVIFALTDETFSLVCAPSLPKDIDRKKYYLFLSLFNQSYWIIGSLLGAIVGDVITFNTAGIDFSMTALFVIIFVEQWEKAKEHLSALTGVIITAICLLIFGASDFLLPSMIFITIALFAEKKLLSGLEARSDAR